MDKNQIMTSIEEIFQDIFDDDDLKLKASDTPNEIKEWDSLTNVNIIVSLESEFGVKFNLDQISSIKSVGDMVSIIYKLKQ